MNLPFGITISREKQNEKKIIQNNIGFVQSQGFSYLGNSLANCGKVRLDNTTFYKIGRNNTEAQSAKSKIVDMVGKNGFILRNEMTKEIVEDPILHKEIMEYFTDPISGTFQGHKEAYFNHNFGAGQVFAVNAFDGAGMDRNQIVDSRGVQKEMDDLGNTKKYNINGKTYSPLEVGEQIVRQDVDSPGYGLSIFAGVVYTALSDWETSKRNYYFFKNNASPSLFVMLKDTIRNKEELKGVIDQFKMKFTGSEQSHGILAHNDIKDIKTLDVSNSDLQLLELSVFNIQKMGVVFRLNPKLFGWSGNKFGSFSEFQGIAIQGDDEINSYARQYETFLNLNWRKFKDASANYVIEMVNDSFLTKEMKIEMVKDLVDRGIMSRTEGRQVLGMSIENLPNEMNGYTVSSNTISIEDVGSGENI